MPNNTRTLIQRGFLFLLGLLLAKLWSREGPCLDDPAIEIGQGQLMVSPCDCFSESYLQSREKFRQAAKSLSDTKIYTFPVQADKDFTIDIAVVKGSKPGTVVHTSGYHGVEGYAGSAIQVAWMKLQTFENRKEIPTVILVHAVNPNGMATFRRTNENNVDLNRNGLHEDEWKKVLARDANIANYQDFDSTLFNIQRPPTLLDRYFRIHVIAAASIVRNGLSKLKRAMVSGQYHNERGIFYGGTKLQQSLQILWDFLETHVSRNETVTMVNVHTGLGPSGQDTIITASHSGISPQELKEVFAHSNIPSLTQSATDVTAGYDIACGTAEDFFSKLFTKQSDWIVTQEFGTIHMAFVGIALILENMARQYLPAKEALEWTHLTRGAFYIRTRKWRKQVLVRGLRVMQQAFYRTETPLANEP